MRILHLSSEYPPQEVFGLGRFVFDLAGAQAAAGHEVCVITNSMGGDQEERLDRGVRVCRVHVPPPPKPADDPTTVMQFNAQLIERAIPLLDHWRPDIVNAHDWLTAVGSRIVAQIAQIPLVVTIHDTVVGKRFGALENDQRFIARIERWAGEHANRVICCSQSVRNELLTVYGVPDSRIAVIPCGVDADAFASAVPAAHLAAFRTVLAAPEEPIVLYVGRLDTEKGLDTLANAWLTIARHHHRAKLVIAGQGVMRESLERWFVDQGVAERVVWTGYVRPPALALLYRVAEVHVVPSRYEPFGIVALEGMASGTTVVAADTGGLADIVTDRQNGRVFPPGDIDQLAAVVLDLVDDAPQRLRLAAAGRRLVREQFSWSRIAADTTLVYQTCLVDRPTPADQKPLIPHRTIPAIPRRSGKRLLFDCAPIHEGMTGIGIYADQILTHLPDVWPDVEPVLLTSARNEHALGSRHGHRLLRGGPECECRFPARSQALEAWARHAEADVIFSPMYTAPVTDQIPAVTMIHDLAFLDREDALPQDLRDFTIRSSEHAARTATIVTVSQVVRQRIALQYGIAPDRIVVASPGIDDCLEPPPAADQARVTRQYDITGPYLLAVNLTNPRKNAEGLFAAIAEVIATWPDLQVVIAGGWNIDGCNLWRTAYRHGVHRRTVLTGYVSRIDLRCLYAGARVLCIPSFDEGFGMPLAEALASGIPVVASDLPIFHEVAGTSAIYVDPTSPSDLARGLLEALDQYPEPTRRQAVQRFTWKAAATVIADALRHAMGVPA